MSKYEHVSLKPGEQCSVITRGVATHGIRPKRQCLNPAIKDGLCLFHHPDNVRMREEAKNRGKGYFDEDTGG